VSHVSTRERRGTQEPPYRFLPVTRIFDASRMRTGMPASWMALVAFAIWTMYDHSVRSGTRFEYRGCAKPPICPGFGLKDVRFVAPSGGVPDVGVEAVELEGAFMYRSASVRELGWYEYATTRAEVEAMSTSQ
jgi:hypothetical protein